MPLPVIVCLAFAAGVLIALAGRSELRVSPRPPLLTQSFGAYAMYSAMLLLPIGVYFYVFHGDWFMLYSVDVAAVPSAIAMLGFMAIGALGAGGFVIGAFLVRSQRDAVAAGIASAALLSCAASVGVFRERLAQVGTYEKYVSGVGLQPFDASPVMQGTMLMTLLALLGLAGAVGRLWWTRRRRA